LPPPKLAVAAVAAAAAAVVAAATVAAARATARCRAPIAARTVDPVRRLAPAAAHLAEGVSIESLGRAVDPRRLQDLEWPAPRIYPGRLRTQAIYLDTFGNVKLSALADDLAAALPGLRLGERLVVRIGEGPDRRDVSAVWARTFGEVRQGAPLLTADSYGRASLAVHLGSAAAAFGVTLDAPIEVIRPAVRPPPRPVVPSYSPRR